MSDKLREALEAVEPYLDAITCYASTIKEHEGNRVAQLVRAALAQPQNDAEADWSDLPKDIYVTSARRVNNVGFDLRCCSVPMVMVPEVRYVRSDMITAPASEEHAQVSDPFPERMREALKPFALLASRHDQLRASGECHSWIEFLTDFYWPNESQCVAARRVVEQGGN